MAVTLVQAAGTLGAAKSQAFPLGVSELPGGPADSVNVAVYAPSWRDVVLCYRAPSQPWRALLLPDLTDGVHHAVVTGMPVGTRYGFRVGPQPGSADVVQGLGGSRAGMFIDPEAEQLLLDPYGRYIDEQVAGDTTTYISVRMASGFDWGDVTRPNVPWRNTVFYLSLIHI